MYFRIAGILPAAFVFATRLTGRFICFSF